MKKIIALLLACMMIIGLFAGCGEKAEEITLTVWGPQADQGENGHGWLQQQCEAYAKAHPEYKITFNYGVCSEGDAATQVGKDPSAAGDVFFYANDQIGTLLQSNALAQFGGDFAEQIKANNSDAMVNSVTYTDGGIYGVPFTPNS